MKLRIALAGLLIAASATSAMAAGPYIGTSAGLSFFHDSDLSEGPISGTASYDTGVAVNVGAGYRFDSGVRLEGEYGYKKTEMDEISARGMSVKLADTDVSVHSFMVNGYYDFLPKAPVTPVVGVGLGALRGKISDEGGDFHDNVFGYQLTAGASFRINKNFNIDVAYRFQGAASDFTFDGVDFSYHSSNILGGLRYTFQ